MSEVEQAWVEYLDALDRCCDAVKLTAYHTEQCTNHAEDTCHQTKLAVGNIREYLEKCE